MRTQSESPGAEGRLGYLEPDPACTGVVVSLTHLAFVGQATPTLTGARSATDASMLNRGLVEPQRQPDR